MDYCPRCLCETCLPITEAAIEKKRRRDEAQARVEARWCDAEDRRLRMRDLILGEQAIIWMLVNTAPDNVSAQEIMVFLSYELDLRTAQVDAKRRRYAQELALRADRVLRRDQGERLVERLHAANALGDSAVHPYTFHKIPGSTGSQLPPDTWPAVSKFERRKRGLS